MTPGDPPAPVFSGSISSALHTESSSVRQSENLGKQVEKCYNTFFFPAELCLCGFASLAWQAFAGRGKKAFLRELAAALDDLHRR